MPRNKSFQCAECLCELQPWETVYGFEGKWYCEDCFEAKFDELTLDEKARLIGSEVRTVEDFYT